MADRAPWEAASARAAPPSILQVFAPAHVRNDKSCSNGCYIRVLTSLSSPSLASRLLSFSNKANQQLQANALAGGRWAAQAVLWPLPSPKQVRGPSHRREHRAGPGSCERMARVRGLAPTSDPTGARLSPAMSSLRLSLAP
ncbi:hypothetical protein BS78_06G031900 [Paspalum vaginatum]|nr:hypothetical protein BS78_06G031900 [Paspalum vaginatum]